MYAHELVDQIQKDFCEFYLFLKVILYFLVFIFGQNVFYVFFIKKQVQGLFREKLATKKLLAKRFEGNIFFFLVTQRLSRLSRDQQLLAKCCLAKTEIFLKSDRESRDCIAT